MDNERDSTDYSFRKMWDGKGRAQGVLKPRRGLPEYREDPATRPYRI